MIALLGVAKSVQDSLESLIGNVGVGFSGSGLVAVNGAKWGHACITDSCGHVATSPECPNSLLDLVRLSDQLKVVKGGGVGEVGNAFDGEGVAGVEGDVRQG